MRTTKVSLKLSCFFNLILLVSFISTFYETSAPAVSRAYLDPGTGSMIISAIIGIFATIALGLKTFWYKIARIFKSDKKKNPASTDHSGTNKQ